MHALMPLARLPYRPMTDLADLPSIPAIYFAIEHGPTLLYIGQSRDLAERWRNGGKGHHRAAQLVKSNVWLCWYALDPTTSKRQFDILERSLIRRYQPTLNDTRIERQPRVDTRPFAEQQQRQQEGFQRVLDTCIDLEQRIIKAEETMDAQIAASIAWMRRYRAGLEELLDQRHEQQRQLNESLKAIQYERSRFLPLVRSLKKAA